VWGPKIAGRQEDARGLRLYLQPPKLPESKIELAMPMLNPLEVNVRCVISLAPTNDLNFPVPPSIQSYLSIIGTLDADTTYIGSRATFVGEVLTPNKYMVALLGGTHIAMTDYGDPLPYQTCEFQCGPTFHMANVDKLPPALFRDTVARLVTAFAKWKIFAKDTEWAPYFRNEIGMNSSFGVTTMALFDESTLAPASGDAYATGFASPASGPIQKIYIGNLFNTSEIDAAYRVRWDEGGIKRLLFATDVTPASSGGLAIDFSVLTTEDVEGANAVPNALNGDHQRVRISLVANCESPLGCGLSTGVKTIPKFPFQSSSLCTRNGLYTLYVPMSEFTSDASFFDDVQVIGVEFLDLSGDVVVFEPRFAT
jgi:hypothetical protein